MKSNIAFIYDIKNDYFNWFDRCTYIYYYQKPLIEKWRNKLQRTNQKCLIVIREIVNNNIIK